jgi:hypothetical protein
MSTPSRSTGCHERGDVASVVLVVGVGVDDHVGTGLERSVEPGHERRREPSIAGMADHVVDAELAGQLGRSVGAAVVDHQPLDHVEPGTSRREVGDGGRERLPPR